MNIAVPSHVIPKISKRTLLTMVNEITIIAAGMKYMSNSPIYVIRSIKI